MGNYEDGRDNLISAMHYANTIGNPFIYLRLGQCRYELEEHDKVANKLTRVVLL